MDSIDEQSRGRWGNDSALTGETRYRTNNLHLTSLVLYINLTKNDTGKI